LSETLNHATEALVFQLFGVANVKFDSLEEIFNPLNSGVFSLNAQKDTLVKKGMSEAFCQDLL